MTLIIPYTFIAGEKAQAAQINEDFQAVATEVNSIGTDLANAETDITNLTNNKANLNGDSSNRFSVAAPVNNNDAVNKQYFNSLAQYLIGGLVISKADDEYVSCTAGACYDTTGSKILQFASDVSKSEYPYNINATYYVYIVGMPAGGTSTQLLISTSSSSPALPSGYTLYRALGKFTTDESGKIKEVIPYASLSGEDFYSTPRIVDTYVNGSSGYVLYSNNFCVQWGVTWNYTPTITLLKSYGNTDYNISASNNVAGDHYENGGITNVTESSFRFSWGYSGCYWTTMGFIS